MSYCNGGGEREHTCDDIVCIESYPGPDVPWSWEAAIIAIFAVAFGGAFTWCLISSLNNLLNSLIRS